MAALELKFEPTERGFQRADFKDLYNTECSIQASSLATDDAIWLGCNKASIDHTTGKLISPRMHLNREHVAALIPILQYFVDTGELKAPAAR